MPKALIGLDLGTTACKGALLDLELNLLMSAEQSYPLMTLSAEEIEQDANHWWEVSKAVLQRLVSGSGIDPADVLAVSISAQGLSFVPVDRRGDPIRNAFNWLDTRAGRQRAEILGEFDERTLFSITGKRASTAYALPKLLWLKQEEPEIYSRCHKILMAMDFIVARLCGRFVTDHTMAGGTLYYDIHQRSWSRTILERFQLDQDKLPGIEWSGTAAGTLRKEVAEELGLTDRVLVCVGGQDQKVAAMGAGIDLERTTISLGTAMAITQKCLQPVTDQQMRIPCFTDLLNGRWVLEGSGIGTSCLDWLRATFFENLSYDELNAMVSAEDGKRNGVFLFPFFMGPDTLHPVQGIQGFLYGLNFSTTRNQIVKSAFEGLAYQIRENIAVMEDISKPVRELRVFGGGSKSKVWNQLIADVTAKPVVSLFTSETGCVGAGILAGLGAGAYSSAEQAFRHLRIQTVYEPRATVAEQYAEQYREYLRIQHRMIQSR